MAQPEFGVAGIDTLTDASRRDVLELVDGINLQQFIRMARPSKAEQQTRVAAWGITPLLNTYWPESVTLTVTEEAVQHEEYNNIVPVATGEGSVGFDASLVFRARASLSVSGKCTTVDDPDVQGWPSDIVSAIGNYTVGQTLHPPSPGTNPVILTSAEYVKIRTNWHTFSYEKQWIIQGSASGENILDFTDFSLARGDSHYHVITRTYSLAAEGFATQNISVEYYPYA